ncbi:MAG: carbohydrate ABC transporter permease, partial [Pseudomonadota bacterium]
MVGSKRGELTLNIITYAVGIFFALFCILPLLWLLLTSLKPESEIVTELGVKYIPDEITFQNYV